MSPDGKYRYVLTREWDPARPVAAFIMLNPSTADADRDDPTIRRCVGFATRWGMGGILIGNLFAFRATNPDDMIRAADPAGPENYDYIDLICGRAESSGGPVVCAWGYLGSYMGAADTFLGWCLNWGIKPKALRFTQKSGEPEHPLYLPYTCQLQDVLTSPKE